MVAGELATVGRYGDAIAAELARAKLDSAGIEGHLADELTVSIDWQLTNAVGGIRLQVVAAEAWAARAILRSDPLPAGGGSPIPLHEPFNARELHAERAATCALFSCIFPPLILYSLWLVYGVAFERGELRPTVRRQLRFAVAFMLVGLMCLVAWVFGYREAPGGGAG